MRSYLQSWSWFERIWLLSFSVINIFLFVALDDTWLGLTASLTGMLCVVLVAKGDIRNYYFGIINVALLTFISYENQLYGEMLLNGAYYLPLQFIGLWSWKKSQSTDEENLSMGWLSKKELVSWVGIIFATIAITYYVLREFNGNLPVLDSTTTILQAVAMIWMIQRKVEQWILWIIVDVTLIIKWAVLVFSGEGSYSMLVMWSAFLVNAIYGLMNWIKLSKRTEQPNA